MNDAGKQLYNRFYTPLSMTEAGQEIEDCHKQLIERLGKPERKLVPRIMDTQSLIAEKGFIDRFSYGFKLAWELAYELNYLKRTGIPFQLKKRRQKPDFYAVRCTILLVVLRFLHLSSSQF